VRCSWLLLAGQVDVILAQRVVRGLSRSADCPEEHHEYLVTWKELPLEQATWETAAVSGGGGGPACGAGNATGTGCSVLCCPSGACSG
jgi:hypothetical protein